MNEILTAFAELILLSEDYMNRSQIAVAQAEFEVIQSLFRIKGQKVLEDGTVISETRGRPKNAK